MKENLIDFSVFNLCKNAVINFLITAFFLSEKLFAADKQIVFYPKSPRFFSKFFGVIDTDALAA